MWSPLTDALCMRKSLCTSVPTRTHPPMHTGVKLPCRMTAAPDVARTDWHSSVRSLRAWAQLVLPSAAGNCHPGGMHVTPHAQPNSQKAAAFAVNLSCRVHGWQGVNPLSNARTHRRMPRAGPSLLTQQGPDCVYSLVCTPRDQQQAELGIAGLPWRLLVSKAC